MKPKTETVEEFLARGGKVKKKIMTKEFQRWQRRKKSGNSRFKYHETGNGEYIPPLWKFMGNK